jgi:hypothetical protein
MDGVRFGVCARSGVCGMGRMMGHGRSSGVRCAIHASANENTLTPQPFCTRVPFSLRRFFTTAVCAVVCACSAGAVGYSFSNKSLSTKRHSERVHKRAKGATWSPPDPRASVFDFPLDLCFSAHDCAESTPE